jgi:hypothetical protein
LWGGLAIFLGALLALTSWLHVFDALGSTGVAQVGSAVLAFLGVGVIGNALARHVLWVEFGQQIRVRRALRERVIEWSDVASVAFEEERADVRPLEPLANLPGAFGVPGVGAAARLAGVTDIARFQLLFGRLCLRLRGGGAIRCDVRLLEWGGIVALARDRAVPVLQEPPQDTGFAVD